MPCESATAATVDIRVEAPAGLALAGTTTWHGRSRADVHIAFTARATKTGDAALRVRQAYSDGKVVNWSPVVHVGRAPTTARDRAIILLVAAFAVAAWLVLRRRRERA